MTQSLSYVLLLICCVIEACAHVSFLITGHRGRLTTGSILKIFWDSIDIFTHLVLYLNSIHPEQTILCILHFLMFLWHISKAVDSIRINGYSPLRGLFVVNFLDATTYTISAFIGIYNSVFFGTLAIMIYICLRLIDYIY